MSSSESEDSYQEIASPLSGENEEEEMIDDQKTPLSERCPPSPTLPFHHNPTKSLSARSRQELLTPVLNSQLYQCNILSNIDGNIYANNVCNLSIVFQMSILRRSSGKLARQVPLSRISCSARNILTVFLAKAEL